MKYSSGEEVIAKIFEKEKAKAYYEDAIASGKTATIGFLTKAERSTMRL